MEPQVAAMARRKRKQILKDKRLKKGRTDENTINPIENSQRYYVPTMVLAEDFDNDIRSQNELNVLIEMR